MAKLLRPIGHEDRLSIVDHLDELRSRMIVCLAALIVAFGVCFWQNAALLDVLNRALPDISTTSGQQGLAAVPSESAKTRAGLLQAAAADRSLATTPGFSP
jgi:sec-independent protein translocase protein TatC